jgi:hypothetical protein
MDYNKDIKIDETLLDLECTDQPELMMRYSQHCAQMEKEKDEAKEDMEFTKADLDRDIRSNPEKYKLEKITDKVAESTVLLQDRYIKASEKYIQAKYEWMVAKGAVEAISARKDMLEALIKLYLGQYFAGPKVPHNLTEFREIRRKQNDAGVASKLTRSTRTT